MRWGQPGRQMNRATSVHGKCSTAGGAYPRVAPHLQGPPSTKIEVPLRFGRRAWAALGAKKQMALCFFPQNRKRSGPYLDSGRGFTYRED